MIKISKNCEIDKNAKLVGDVLIEDNVKIVGECYIENSIIRKNTKILSSYIINSQIGQDVNIGPYAHIRNNSIIGNNCRIGNFVEIKNSKINDDTKCAHLAYVGDAIIGERVNIGCGVVFANYNGKIKQESKIGNDVFIGCNCNIVAPCVIEDGCFIAAGTTVTKNLPSNSFCIGRVREEFKKKS